MDRVIMAYVLGNEAEKLRLIDESILDIYHNSTPANTLWEVSYSDSKAYMRYTGKVLMVRFEDEDKIRKIEITKGYALTVNGSVIYSTNKKAAREKARKLANQIKVFGEETDKNGRVIKSRKGD